MEPVVVDGKRMHCGLLEEPDMDSTGQSDSALLLRMLVGKSSGLEFVTLVVRFFSFFFCLSHKKMEYQL